MRTLDWKTYDVLVVDDEEDNLDAFRFSFRKSFTLHYAQSGAEALDLCDRLDPAVIVSDQRMPKMSGIEFLRQAKERRPDAFGVLLTAYADLPVLIDAINSGAVDRYVQKPWDSKELTIILRQAIATFDTVRENRRLREQLAHYAGYLEQQQRDPLDYGELAGTSDAMRTVQALLDEVAPTSSPVLIRAEPGSEQDVVASAIHVGSPREEAPFVRVTCAAYRGDALEREVFGWRKGSFDSAYADRAGRVELADRGTLYLDNPDTLSPSMQDRLLRLLREGRAERVGDTDSREVDVRLILAVNRNDDQWLGSLLPDLRSRLTVFPVELQPLRNRPEDIEPLAKHFLRKYGDRNVRAATTFASETLVALREYAFPGNARELENVVERAAIHARGDVIRPVHLAFETPAAGKDAVAPSSRKAAEPPHDAPAGKGKTLDRRLDDIERSELLAALEDCQGNKAEVARRLGVQRTTLYYRLKRLGIDT